MIGFESMSWRVVKPGLIELTPTSVRIRMHDDGHYAVEWQGHPVLSKGYYLTIACAKQDALAYVNDLLEMGHDL